MTTRYLPHRAVFAADSATIGSDGSAGFTVSLFVADLSFSGPELEVAKVAILVASLLAGGLGALAIKRASSAASR